MNLSISVSCSLSFRKYFCLQALRHKSKQVFICWYFSYCLIFINRFFGFVRFPVFLYLSHSVAPSCCFGFPQNEIQMFFWSAGGERAEDRKGGGGGVNVQSFSIHKEEEKIVGVENRREILEYGAKVCEDGRLGALNPWTSDIYLDLTLFSSHI